jgi:UPF0716 family protein affecting phage T7 exclusion
MIETISMTEAIRKGNSILRPLRLLVIAILIVGIILIKTGYFSSLILAVVIICVLIFLVGLFYRAVVIPKWKIWAFANVRNVHELKRRAIINKIIWKPDSVMEGFEIWVKEDKIKWHQIQRKFEIPDENLDDFSVPLETRIYYSNRKLYSSLFYSIIPITFGLIGINHLPGIFFLILGLFILIPAIKDWTKNIPQLTINDEYLLLKDSKSYYWNQIEKIGIEFDSNNNPSLNVNDETFEIMDWEMDWESIDSIIRVYKLRNMEKFTINNPTAHSA